MSTPADRPEAHEHLFVNYGTKSAPRPGCFICGCTPTDPTPEAVQS